MLVKQRANPSKKQKKKIKIKEEKQLGIKWQVQENRPMKNNAVPFCSIFIEQKFWSVTQEKTREQTNHNQRPECNDIIINIIIVGGNIGVK